MHLSPRAMALVAALSSAIVLAPETSALTVGPGSPIVIPDQSATKVNNLNVPAAYCSTSVPGKIVNENNESERVLVTAGHCVSPMESPDPEESFHPSSEVYAPTHQGDEKIGTVSKKNFMNDESVAQYGGDLHGTLNEAFNSGDWAFITLDDDVDTTSYSTSVDEYGNNVAEPVKMTGVQDYPRLGKYEVSIDNLGDPICKDGARTGRSCGVQIFRSQNGIWATDMAIDKGDSGGNAYNPDTNQAIGINSMGIGPVSRYQPIDSAIEDAYNVPDGQVNDYFQIDNSDTPRTEQPAMRENIEAHKQAEATIKPQEPETTDEEKISEAISDIIPADLPELPELPIADLPVDATLNAEPAIQPVQDSIHNTVTKLESIGSQISSFL